MSKDNWCGEFKKCFVGGLALCLSLAGTQVAWAGKDMGFYTGRALFEGANPAQAGVVLKVPESEPMKMKSALIISGAAAGGGAVAGVVLNHVGEGLSGMGAAYGALTATRMSHLRRVEWRSGPGPFKMALGGAILAGGFALLVIGIQNLSIKMTEARLRREGKGN